MPTIPPSATGLSGEYFVAAELLRRGFAVGITMGNTKAIDILAEKDGQQLIIQVKSIYRKKNVGWPIMKDSVKNNCFYIFVNLNADKMISPEYYICTSPEAKEKVKQYATLNNEKYLNNWNKLELTNG